MTRASCIGIIAPASAIKDGEEIFVKEGINLLKDWGFKIIEATNLYSQYELLSNENSFYAGTVSERINGLMSVWKEADILLSLRGGYGSIELLDGLDYDFIAKNPRPLLGYSDITALHQGLISKAYKNQLPSFHTPMLSELSRLDQLSLNSLKTLLSLLDIDSFQNYNFTLSNNEIWNNYKMPKASAKVFGGNLTTLLSLIGTEFQPSFENRILFLEECKEPAYKIQRLFYQLKLNGILDNIQELWIGTGFEAQYDYNRISELCSKPIQRDLPIGHSKPNLSLILG